MPGCPKEDQPPGVLTPGGKTEVTGSLALRERPTPAPGIRACAIAPRPGQPKVLYAGSLGGRWHARHACVRVRVVHVCACAFARACVRAPSQEEEPRVCSGSVLENGVFPSRAAPGPPSHADPREAGAPCPGTARPLRQTAERAPLRRPGRRSPPGAVQHAHAVTFSHQRLATV